MSVEQGDDGRSEDDAKWIDEEWQYIEYLNEVNALGVKLYGEDNVMGFARLAWKYHRKDLGELYRVNRDGSKHQLECDSHMCNTCTCFSACTVCKHLTNKCTCPKT